MEIYGFGPYRKIRGAGGGPEFISSPLLMLWAAGERGHPDDPAVLLFQMPTFDSLGTSFCVNFEVLNISHNTYIFES